MREIADSLARAFDRIDAFQHVQAETTGDELREAVELLQESVGIRGDERELIRERLAGVPGCGHAPGELLLGLVIGLMAGEEG